MPLISLDVIKTFVMNDEHKKQKTHNKNEIITTIDAGTFASLFKIL